VCSAACMVGLSRLWACARITCTLHTCVCACACTHAPHFHSPSPQDAGEHCSRHPRRLAHARGRHREGTPAAAHPKVHDQVRTAAVCRAHWHMLIASARGMRHAVRVQSSAAPPSACACLDAERWCACVCVRVCACVCVCVRVCVCVCVIALSAAAWMAAWLRADAALARLARDPVPGWRVPGTQLLPNSPCCHHTHAPTCTPRAPCRLQIRPRGLRAPAHRAHPESPRPAAASAAPRPLAAGMRRASRAWAWAGGCLAAFGYPPTALSRPLGPCTRCGTLTSAAGGVRSAALLLLLLLLWCGACGEQWGGCSVAIPCCLVCEQCDGEAWDNTHDAR
jgi:hypothetical protein